MNIPHYQPDVTVNVLAYVRHRLTGRRFSPKRFGVLVAAQNLYRDLLESWHVLYGSEYVLHGFIIREEPICQSSERSV